jgi:hypothetical protein
MFWVTCITMLSPTTSTWLDLRISIILSPFQSCTNLHSYYLSTHSASTSQSYHLLLLHSQLLNLKPAQQCATKRDLKPHRPWPGILQAVRQTQPPMTMTFQESLPPLLVRPQPHLHQEHLKRHRPCQNRQALQELLLEDEAARASASHSSTSSPTST